MMLDSFLIEKALNGNEYYKTILYNKYKPIVYKICSYFFKHSYDINEVLQLTFIKIFTKLHQYQGKGSFEGWIKKTTKTTAINYLRSNKKFKTHIPLSNELYIEEQKEILTRSELLYFLNTLPKGYRKIYIAYELNNYTHKEIANFYNISENTSKTQLHKAKKQLQKTIKKYL